MKSRGSSTSVLTEAALRKRDSTRDIGAELLGAIRDIKAGRHGTVRQVAVNAVVEARVRSGLSQTQFAAALSISPRTLQQWEQGRRSPSGAAATLIHIVARHPEVLREIVSAG